MPVSEQPTNKFSNEISAFLHISVYLKVYPNEI